MTFSEIKKILLDYPRMTEKVNTIRREIEQTKNRINSLREVSAVNIDGMPHSYAVSDTTYQKAQKIVDDYDDHIRSLLEELEEIQGKQMKIGQLLRTLTPEEHRVVEARYVNGIGWDFIPGRIGICRAKCFTLHDQAVKKILKDF